MNKHECFEMLKPELPMFGLQRIQNIEDLTFEEWQCFRTNLLNRGFIEHYKLAKMICIDLSLDRQFKKPHP